MHILDFVLVISQFVADYAKLVVCVLFRFETVLSTAWLKFTDMLVKKFELT